MHLRSKERHPCSESPLAYQQQRELSFRHPPAHILNHDKRFGKDSSNLKKNNKKSRGLIHQTLVRQN